MLQRIQTIFLFVSFLAAALLIFFPISSFTSADQEVFKLYIGGVKPLMENSPNTVIMLILTPALGILTFFSILRFKNRPLQLKINNAAMFVNLGLLIAIFFYTEQISGYTNIKSFSYLTAAYFPVISLLTIILANRSIRKDEKLIKKSDRLR